MRLIDADDLMKKIEYAWVFTDDSEIRKFKIASYRFLDLFEKIVYGSPTIDAEPIKHGKWIERDDQMFENVFDCSCCNESFVIEDALQIDGYKYCVNCGAKMDLGGAKK